MITFLLVELGEKSKLVNVQQLKKHISLIKICLSFKQCPAKICLLIRVYIIVFLSVVFGDFIGQPPMHYRVCSTRKH